MTQYSVTLRNEHTGDLRIRTEEAPNYAQAQEQALSACFREDGWVKTLAFSEQPGEPGAQTRIWLPEHGEEQNPDSD